MRHRRLCATAVAPPAAADTINLRVGAGHPIGLIAYTETEQEWFVPELKKRMGQRTDHTVNIPELQAGQVAKVAEVPEAKCYGLFDIGFISLTLEPASGFI